MAGSFNRVLFVGRLTRDPETRSFQSGASVTTFGLAFTGERRKNSAGEWEEVPCFVDCKAFTSQQGRGLGSIVERYCTKGSQVHVEGHLILEQWDDKNTGQKRQALRVIVDSLVLLGTKNDDGAGGSRVARGGGNRRPNPEPETEYPEPDNRGADTEPADIPF